MVAPPALNDFPKNARHGPLTGAIVRTFRDSRPVQGRDAMTRNSGDSTVGGVMP
jgi:hypothetical protein